MGVTHQKGVQTMRSVVESGVLTIRRKRLPQEENDEVSVTTVRKGRLLMSECCHYMYYMYPL